MRDWNHCRWIGLRRCIANPRWGQATVRRRNREAAAVAAEAKNDGRWWLPPSERRDAAEARRAWKGVSGRGLILNLDPISVCIGWDPMSHLNPTLNLGHGSRSFRSVSFSGCVRIILESDPKTTLMAGWPFSLLHVPAICRVTWFDLMESMKRNRMRLISFVFLKWYYYAFLTQPLIK